MLKKKVAIVTGSAKGLGREIAICLAKNGADVVVHYNKSFESANSVKKNIEELGRCSIIMKADLTNPKEVQSMFKKIYDKFKKIDILINNVGNFLIRDLKDIDFKEWRYIIDTTLNTTFFCCKACLPFMRENKYGRIINIGDSEADKISASLMMTPYKIGKVGVLMLTKSLALSEAKNNITVNAVSPGIMENSVFKPTLKHAPMGRYVKFNDVTNAITFLLAPESGHITGACIVVSGGWNL